MAVEELGRAMQKLSVQEEDLETSFDRMSLKDPEEEEEVVNVNSIEELLQLLEADGWIANEFMKREIGKFIEESLKHKNEVIISQSKEQL